MGCEAFLSGDTGDDAISGLLQVFSFHDHGSRDLRCVGAQHVDRGFPPDR